MSSPLGETNTRPSFVARAKKALAAALGVAAMVVTTSALEENVEVWVNAALAVATALGVYGVKNAEPTA